MFRELIEKLPPVLRPFSPYGPADDREFWSSLPERTRSAAIARGDEFSGYAYPPLPATLYMDFSRTGNRARFEEPYFRRRLALNALVLAECARGDGRYLDGIIDGIDALCSETAWQLPAHNSYVRDAPQLILPDTGRPVLDLFACETGALLATARYLLRSELDAASPSITRRILRVLQERILAPYLHEHFWWMGNGDEPMCNWTPWCTQNVLLVAGMGDLDQDTLRSVIVKSAGSLDCFLKDYGDDGCCDEGAQYYRHAGLCLALCMDALNAMSSDVFAPLFREEKIRNIALFILNMHVVGEHYFNFGDCSPIAGRAGSREFLFGKRIGDAALMRFAAADAAEAGAEAAGAAGAAEAGAAGAGDLPDEINLYYRLQAIATSGEMEAFARDNPETEGAPPPLPDVWYPSVGVFVARSAVFSLAVKAGGNGDNHNHNDTGSFILYKEGKPCIIDVGVESYTAKTFSPRRYEIWTMQSAYHNLPTFGGCQQRDGASYRARDERISFDPEVSCISMELSGAYPPESGVHSYRRAITLDKRTAAGAVLVEDRCEGELPPVLSLMTPLEPVVQSDGTIAVGELARVETGLDPSRIAVEPIDISDPRLQAGWGKRIYRILLSFGDSLSLRIR